VSLVGLRKERHHHQGVVLALATLPEPLIGCRYRGIHWIYHARFYLLSIMVTMTQLNKVQRSAVQDIMLGNTPWGSAMGQLYI
jgi:hypothetical protein